MALKFSTKAGNLQALQGKLKTAKILPLVITNSLEFSKNTKLELEKIAKLKAKKLIIRSSSRAEDSSKNSNAGAFLSLANINANDTKAIKEALLKVAKSMPSENDEILIQPCLENIEICGVGFSVDKDNFSPYFCLQYDESGSNSGITDGSAKNLKSYFHHREYNKFSDKNTQKIIKMIKELERLFKCEFLDVEFAFAGGELYCLQVRPLVMSGKVNLSKALPLDVLKRLEKRLNSMARMKPRILGTKAIFGVMPDWNPAEIIGLRPKRLALSLYKEIITDNIWAYQRDNYGYRDLRSHPLIYSFLGLPYVDVRISFNSFVPKNLDEKIASKLVDFYLKKLDLNHDLHDKVEFKIVFSCYDFTTSKRLASLLDEGFNENELKRLEYSLLELTNDILNKQKGLYLKDIKKAANLASKFKKIEGSNLSLIDKIYWLLEECKRYGTLPFAGVARAAFVAMQMLNSLVEIKLLSLDEKNDFLNSLQTISKTLSLESASLNEQNKGKFLAKFGHLRAGTYNINSPRYDEAFEKYFDLSQKNDSKLGKIKPKFELENAKKARLNELLQEHGINIDANALFEFFKVAIEGRELVKFEFSKLLSKAISYISELANHYEISLSDMGHIDIKSILSLYSSLYASSPKMRLLDEIKHNKLEYELTSAIKLPPLLSNPSQIYAFFEAKNTPNFITQKSIQAFVACENDSDLQGKIVLIRAADPGYDYLFSKKIAAFITCWGGANSHMAIRASELGLPAVIGVGEVLFEKCLKAKQILIECESEQILCL